MTTEPPVLLDIRHLSLEFASDRGVAHALRDVSVTVPAGRIVGLVGESGSGKSTLAFSIIGLLASNARITGGQILFKGDDLLGVGPRKMRAVRGAEISVVFQDPMTSLNPVLSIGRQMIDIQHRDRASVAAKRARAVEMLAKVGIPDARSRLNAYPHQFSGGMRQRICIAMALLMRPALLLADEPTTALDATLEVQVIHLLKDLQSEIGCSILFVSHHLGTVAELCDDMVMMYAGEVVEAGPVGEVFRSPGHPYTRALLECEPGRIRERTRRLPSIPGDVPSLLQVAPGCIFAERCRQVFDRCRHEHPEAHVIASAHHARCHLLDRRVEEQP